MQVLGMDGTRAHEQAPPETAAAQVAAGTAVGTADQEGLAHVVRASTEAYLKHHPDCSSSEDMMRCWRGIVALLETVRTETHAR